MEKEAILRQLKIKKMGALLMDARLASSRNVEDCAHLLGISREAYLDFEKGNSTPSIPQLEALSYYLDIPLAHFRGSISRYEASLRGYRTNLEKILLVRDRIIGARIRKSRLDREINIAEFANQLAISVHTLEQYELGKHPIPLDDLERIAAALEESVDSYFEQYEQEISQKNQEIRIQQFLELSDSLQEFVTKPVNRPFLELASKLADLPVDRLRAVAEGLLEITY